MKLKLPLLFGIVFLTVVSVFAQEEQASSAATASARFWISPRVQQVPPVPSEKLTFRTKPIRAEQLTIQNESLRVNWTLDGFTIISRASGRAFATEASFNAFAVEASVTRVSDKTFGSGKAIEISRPDGERDSVMLFPKVPFALFRSRLQNGGSGTNLIRTVRLFQTVVDLSVPATALKTFGTGGLLTADENPGSYAWLAVVEPQSRNSVVFGWLTDDRGSGVLFSKTDGNKLRVGGQIDYGQLRLAPGQSADLETLAVGYFDDGRLGLETWADEVAKVYKIHLPPQPAGYCTWYSQPYGGASDEKHLAEQAAFAATNLAPFGFSVVQIDDHWQEGLKADGPKRNFNTHDPEGPYPSGMKAAADNLKSLGLVPGLWFIPFAGTSADPYFTNHLDWFVKMPDGTPYQAKWGGTPLDMTYPPARDYLASVVHRITHDWGYEYIKIDGLWTGSATKLNYVNSGYAEDDIGLAVFHDPMKPNIEAFRDGLRLLRKAAGPKVFVLGCNGPQNMRSYGGAFGLVDAMRVGPDNGAQWNRLTRGTVFGSRHYFLNGRVWYDDPDPDYVRASIPLNHAQLICSWVAISGELNLSSEWFPGLPPDRLDILKRTMPSHGLPARPADLFENDPPKFWLLSDTRRQPRRDVIAAFNWEDGEQKLKYPMDRLGLDGNTEYVAFDYWQNTLIPSIKGSLELTLPGQSCCVLAVRPVANHPQLISTSRHITQGIVDVTEEKWSAGGKTLSGRSKVVGGDSYELRVVIPDPNWTAASAKVSGDKTSTSFTQNGNLVRVTIESPSSQEVAWSVKFK